MALTPEKHEEWWSRWANLRVEEAKEEIEWRKTKVAKLRQELASAGNDELRDLLESQIDRLELNLKSIRLWHREMQCVAKHRWNLAMPDLA